MAQWCPSHACGAFYGHHGAPVVQNTCSVEDAASVEDNTTPVEENTIAVEENTAPVKENTAPVKENTAPVKENTARCGG